MAHEDLIAAAIVSAASGLGLTMRWAVGRITKALDDNTAAAVKQAAEAAVQAEAFRNLTTKIDRVADWIDDMTPPPRDPPARPARAASQPARRSTPAKGSAIGGPGLYGVRAASRGDDDV